jgi:hypothetical protein
LRSSPSHLRFFSTFFVLPLFFAFIHILRYVLTSCASLRLNNRKKHQKQLDKTVQTKCSQRKSACKNRQTPQAQGVYWYINGQWYFSNMHLFENVPFSSQSSAFVKVHHALKMDFTIFKSKYQRSTWLWHMQ